MPRRNANAEAAPNEGGGPLTWLKIDLHKSWSRMGDAAKARREQDKTEQRIQQLRKTYGTESR